MDLDIKLVSHAKDYIDDLAKGIDPFTKKAVSDDDIVNNVKISRCLFFVSDVLNEVIINGGVGKRSVPKKEEFDLARVPLDSVVISSKPEVVSFLTNQINALKPDNMKRLTATAVTNWLVDIGFLENVIINNKTYKKPTAAGARAGIAQDMRTGADRTYYVNLYSESAQRFIIDNLQTVIDSGYNSGKSNSPNSETADEN